MFEGENEPKVNSVSRQIIPKIYNTFSKKVRPSKKSQNVTQLPYLITYYQTTNAQLF